MEAVIPTECTFQQEKSVGKMKPVRIFNSSTSLTRKIKTKEPPLGSSSRLKVCPVWGLGKGNKSRERRL